MQVKFKLARFFVLICLVIVIPLSTASAQTSVFINEIHYDNTSTDAGEAIEIAGPAGTDLSGWSIVLYNGNGGAVYDTDTLSGLIPDQQGGFGTVSISYPSNGIQNGSPDGIALVDASNAVVQFLSYEGSFTATDGPAVGMTSTDIGVAESSSTPVGDSLQLTGSGSVYEDFTWTAPAANTFDAVNTGQTFTGGGPDYTPIYDIQYTTDPSGDSPLADQADITTEGIVTALFYNGYFIEDPAGGAWNGLWVYDTTNFPALGDRVRLTGTVLEYYNFTELGGLTDYVLVSSGNSLPDPVVVTTAAANDEQYEGVLLRVENVLVTAEEDAYEEWAVDDGSGPLAVDNLGSDTYVPVMGDEIAAIVGPLNYSYNAFKIAPRDDGDITLPMTQALLINEVDADTPSTDVLEFIELYDGGDGNTALDGLVVVLYNGNGDTSYNAFDLDGYNTNADGYFLLGNADVVPTPDIIFSSNGLQNGADAVALYIGDAADFPNGTALTTDNLVDAVVYDTNDADDAGLLVLLNADQPQVNENSNGNKDDESNQRCPNGEGGARNTDTYQQFAPTPGDENVCSAGPAFGACGDPATFIHDVQGNGDISPLNGAPDVIIEGVVVGDFQDTSTQLKGFFLQEEDGDVDADPTTSEGMFVYDYGFMDVNVGDVVRVMGSVAEYYELTELKTISNMAICGTGTASAATVELPVASLDVWEQHEGMLVHIPQTLYATGNYAQGRYGEVELSVNGRLDTPTNVVLPGGDAIALQELNDRSRIQLEDGSTIQNPDVAPYLGADNTLRAGDTIPGLTGVLHYSFDYYELHPTETVNFTRVNTREAAPPDVGGTLKVASANVLNYFTTLDEGAPVCGPTGGMDCRGANTAEEFVRQRTKIINAISTMDADVIGLMEMENHPTDDALQDLMNGLNEAVGAGTYDFVQTGPIGTDAIKLALIYKPGVATPVGPYAILDSSVDPTFLDTKNRPSLAQTFMQNATGARFTVVVNHLKSKGSDCEDVGDPDTGDGQGNCNLTRTDAATALVNWLATDPTGSGDPDFIIIGDMNAYAMEDPIAAITGAGYTNLLEAFIGTDAYSYVFDGMKGYLDHALASPALASQVTGVAEWHINADEPAALDYNDYNQDYLYTSEPYRAADHDPVLIGLDLNAPPDCSQAVPSISTLWPANHKFVPVSVWGVTDPDGDTLTFTIDSIFQDEPVDATGSGNTAPDGRGVGTSIAEVRAERAATGNGRFYHITFTASDGRGGTCQAEILVSVPRNRGKKGTPIDDGPLYDSTATPF